MRNYSMQPARWKSVSHVFFKYLNKNAFLTFKKIFSKRWETAAADNMQLKETVRFFDI